jgi:Rod binding domain-containing protein
MVYVNAQSSSLPVTQSAKNEKLKEMTDEFESLFVKMYLEKGLTMNDSLFGKGVGSDIYNGMYVDALSHEMGGKMGLSEILYQHLEEKN